jgi:hypothetical protein
MKEMGAAVQFRTLFSRLPSTPAKSETFTNIICNYFAWAWDFSRITGRLSCSRRDSWEYLGLREESNMWIGNTEILHNAELHGFHSLPNIMLATCFVLLLLLPSSRRRKTKACGQHKRGRKCFKPFLGKHEEKRIFGRHRNRWKN